MSLVRSSVRGRRHLHGGLALGLCTLAVALVLAAPLDAQEARKASGGPPAQPEGPAEPPVIRWTEAQDHIGEEVTVEGEIVATHTSPLSTLLSFDKGFNRFTAVIQPAARAAFPPNPEEYYKGKLVRVRGRVIEYEKKPEILLKSPSQITVIPAETAAAPAEAEEPEEQDDTSTLVTLELLRRLTAIESSLQDLADRLDLILTALEQQAPRDSPAHYLLPGRVPETEPPERPAFEHLRSLKRGMTAMQVQELLGEPAFVDPNSEGGEIWYYGSGRTISFNRRGRVEAMAGFQERR